MRRLVSGVVCSACLASYARNDVPGQIVSWSVTIAILVSKGMVRPTTPMIRYLRNFVRFLHMVSSCKRQGASCGCVFGALPF